MGWILGIDEGNGVGWVGGRAGFDANRGLDGRRGGRGWVGEKTARRRAPEAGQTSLKSHGDDGWRVKEPGRREVVSQGTEFRKFDDF